MIETCVPPDLSVSSFESVQPLFLELQDRDVKTSQELEQWLFDRSELTSACSEAVANLYITMTCDTDDQAASAAYKAFVEDIEPKIKPLQFQLDRRLLELSDQLGLDPERYAVLVRDTSVEVEIFREENVPLQAKLKTLAQDYQATIGAMMVEFDGADRTMAQMAKYQENTDREVRERAWRASADRRLRDGEDIDTVFDEMIALRHSVAKNAGFDNYVGYAFKQNRRFDYTANDCFAFHDACERFVGPFAKRRDQERCQLLGLSSLRAWDLEVDPQARDPLRPFSNGVELVSKSLSVFERLDPRLGEMFASLGHGSTTRGSRDGAKLDLDSRKGKAPGGYQYVRDRIRQPFIFMNAAGLHRDVAIMIHEAGHAFHSMLCRGDPLVHYRAYPSEIAEVASMSMELLTIPYWSGGDNAFYPDEADANRARRKQLEGSVTLLGWVATIDAFQHWLYTNHEHTRDQRTRCWLTLMDRFGAHGHFPSWEGLEDYRGSLWQRQEHLFANPFYYIEYGIAQLGAMQLWLRSLEDGEGATIGDYVNGLKLGGSKPLPELFAAVGLEFDFGPGMVEHLVGRVEAELSKLPG